MAIKVCDSIMGSGKSMAAIDMFNSHPDKKFLYVTPYLEEGRRIKDACPALEFCEPSDMIREHGYRKSEHARALLEQGRNVVSTHAMITRYGNRLIEAVRENGYTLVIDEALNVLNASHMERADLLLLEEAGYIDSSTGQVTGKAFPDKRSDEKYGAWLDLLRTGRMVMEGSEASKRSYMYWQFNREILDAFEDVYILTYMFDCQDLKYYFELNGMEYENIYIGHPRGGGYMFVSSPEAAYTPSYVGRLCDMIGVIESPSLNAVGTPRTALSASWSHYRSKGFTQKCDRLRRDMSNYFTNVTHSAASDRMWCTYKTIREGAKGRLSLKSFVPYNARAMNKYGGCHTLAFCVNVFMDGHIKSSLIQRGASVDEDGYALSVMLQWIWRSAIRNGEPIQLYVPSQRMRRLLRRWMVRTTKEYAESRETAENTKEGSENGQTKRCGLVCL